MISTSFLNFYKFILRLQFYFSICAVLKSPVPKFCTICLSDEDTFVALHFITAWYKLLTSLRYRFWPLLWCYIAALGYCEMACELFYCLEFFKHFLKSEILKSSRAYSRVRILRYSFFSFMQTFDCYQKHDPLLCCIFQWSLYLLPEQLRAFVENFSRITFPIQNIFRHTVLTTHAVLSRNINNALGVFLVNIAIFLFVLSFLFLFALKFLTECSIDYELKQSHL